MTTTPEKSQLLSNNTLQTFKLDFCGNKQLTVYGTHDEPVFKLKEVATILGIKNYRDIYKGMDTYMKATVDSIDSANLRLDSQLINEAGFYHTIWQSRKPIAKQFRKWAYTEVFPSIRKTGEYKMNQELLELKEENTELKQENAMLIEDKNKLYHDIILANAKAFQRYSNIKQWFILFTWVECMGITYSNLGLVTNSMGGGRLINQRLRCVS